MTSASALMRRFFYLLINVENDYHFDFAQGDESINS